MTERGRTIGAVLRPQVAPERMIEVARAADDAGLAELWLWEDCFLEGGVASAAALLGATERVRIGIGVLPFPLRNVALAAMEVATLIRMFPGRVLPGFGHGVQAWMEQIGARAASPLTLEREYVTALRSLLAGDDVSVEGDYVRLDRVRLGWPPAEVPPIVLAATGPRSLELSGELGDSTLVTSSTPVAELPGIRNLLAVGRARSGRGGEPHLRAYVEVAHRDAARAAATALEWFAGGVDVVVLEPPGDDPDPVAFVRFAAEDVAPRVAQVR